MYKLGWIFVVVAAGLAVECLQGCAFTASVYPVDHTELKQEQSDRPLFCHVFTCQEDKRS